MLSKRVFCVLSIVKITLKNPKIFGKIFNLKAYVSFYSWDKLSRITSKNNANLTLGFWKKIIKKFSTSLWVREKKFPFFFLNLPIFKLTSTKCTNVQYLIFSWIECNCFFKLTSIICTNVQYLIFKSKKIKMVKVKKCSKASTLDASQFEGPLYLIWENKLYWNTCKSFQNTKIYKNPTFHQIFIFKMTLKIVFKKILTPHPHPP